MKEYTKINTVFKRNMGHQGKTKPLIYGAWSEPEFEYLKSTEWIGTEKIDGTNIRIMWQDGHISFGGKTDNAQIPSQLYSYLSGNFTTDIMDSNFSGRDICLYGEGFGNKIQPHGRDYIPDSQKFILFDCKVGDFWLQRDSLEDIAKALNIDIVPVLFRGTLLDAIDVVSNGFTSTVSHNKKLIAEGLILKPTIEMLKRNGSRIITKIKHCDFANITH